MTKLKFVRTNANLNLRFTLISPKRLISHVKKHLKLITNFKKALTMNLKTSPFSILNKERKEIDYIKRVYKRRVQAEIESYKDPDDEDKRDTIQAQDVLMFENIYI